MAQGKTGYVDFKKTNYGFEWTLRLNWSETYDVASNTSNVTITSVQMQGNWSGRTYNGDMLIKINGTTAITLNLNSLNNGVYNAGQDRFNTIVNDPGAASPTVITGSVNNIAHNADGTGTATFSIEKLNLDYPTLYSPYGSSTFNAGSVSAQLTTIPRKSSFSTSGNTIGGAMSFTVTRASSAFTHTLQYRFGTSGSFTNIATGVGTSYSWTIPASFGNSIPTATSGTWQFKCITYNGSTSVGETVNSVTLYIPSDAGPTCADGWAVASLDNTGTSAAGKSTYYTGISKVKVTFDTSKITPRYGATASVKNVSATYNGTTITSTGYLGTIQATSITVTMNATDSRGKTTTATATLTAVQYIAPSLSGVSVFRCDANGDPKNDGTYISIFANVSGQTAGGNALTLKWQYKSTGSYTTAEPINAGAVNKKSGFAQNTSYTVRLTVSDMANSASVDVIVPTAAVAFNLKDGGTAAAFGRYAQIDKTLDIGDWSAIGRVMGLGKARAQIPNNADMNSYVEPGVYAVADQYVYTTLSNRPTTSGYGGNLVVKDVRAQGKNPVTDTWVYLRQEYTDLYGDSWHREGNSGGTANVYTFNAWVADQPESAAGYCKLPDGTLIQWGQAGGYDGVTSKDFTVTMSYAFVNTSYIVSVTNSLGTTSTLSSYDQRINTVVISSTNQFTVHQKVLNGNPVNQFHWIAIGRWK